MPAWALQGTLRGPQGYQGNQGSQGSQGAVGSAAAPTVVCSLNTVVSTYQQAPTVVLQGTFVAPSVKFKLRPQISGYQLGAYGSGTIFRAIVGIPIGGGNNCGGILGEEVNQQGTGGANPASNNVVGTALYPVAGTGGMRGATVRLGSIIGEYVSGNVGRDIIYDNAVPGTTYTVQIIADGVSGLDTGLMPPGMSAHVLGGMAMTPGFDTSQDASLANARDLWVVDDTLGGLHRFAIGRLPMAQYEGIQPRLLWKSSILLPGQTFGYSRLSMDINGIACMASPLANMVSLVNTASNGRTGAVLATTASLGGAVDDVKPAPDGSGFWVAVHNVGLKKINPTTGAVLSTIALAGYATMRLAVSNDGTYIYLWSSSYPGLITVKVSDSTTTTGPTLSAVACMRLSPDGLSLVFGNDESDGGTWSVAKIATGGVNGKPGSGAAITYSTRFGAQLTHASVYDIGFTPDSRMYFVVGIQEIFYYGWLSNMVVFDGVTVKVTNGWLGSGIAVTPNGGIYFVSAQGTASGLPAAQITAFPGGTFICDPVGGNLGEYYADVLLG